MDSGDSASDPRRTEWAAVLLVGFALATGSASAQADSLWEQTLGAVSVTPPSGATVPATGGATLRALPLVGPASATPTLSDAARLFTGAHVQINSRGEALLYFRGSGERQVAVTLDGAPLTTPWDRRADLDLLPVWGLERAVIATGTPSVAWGPNALGGALALTSRRAGSPGRVTEAGVAGGWPASGHLAAAYVSQREEWSLTLAADASTREGLPVASAADLPFSQPPDALRTNTDRTRGAVLARLARGDVAVTVLHTVTARGIAPESHLDPGEESVRYWRYPVARQSIGILNARATIGGWQVGTTAWTTLSAQTVDSYASADYETISSTQSERDGSGGVRALAELPRAWGTLRATLFGLAAHHRQRETGGPSERFRHLEGSAGVEAETGGFVRFSGGASVDVLAPVETGMRPGAGPFVDGALHLGGVMDVAEAVRVRVGGGRKTRFPTMREMFGEALGRFALNPDLRPESAWLVEAGVETERESWRADVVAFARDVTGTIEQVRLPDGRRQRVNLGGSWAVGVEATGDLRPVPGVRLDGAVTLVHQRSDEGERLTERPRVLARLGAEADRGGWRLRLSADGIGGVVSPVPDGLVELPGTVLVTAEVIRRWTANGAMLEGSARANNVLDATHVPQAGLPAPGRSVTVGVRYLF